MSSQARFFAGDLLASSGYNVILTRDSGTAWRKTSRRPVSGPWDGAVKVNSFYERPILNSPYRAPEFHHPLDPNGQPLEGEPRQGRRPSRFIEGRAPVVR
jgi:hypothetical protein